MAATILKNICAPIVQNMASDQVFKCGGEGGGNPALTKPRLSRNHIFADIVYCVTFLRIPEIFWNFANVFANKSESPENLRQSAYMSQRGKWWEPGND